MAAYDFVVIGGGSAGYAAARTAVELGLKTAVIDGADELGGLCILRGCMPSKTLIESANRYRTIRRAREFGLRAEKTSVAPEEIVARKKILIEDFAGYRQGQLQDGRFTLLRGRARYLDATRLAVTHRDGTEETVEARTSLIATGSVVNRIPLPGLEETGYLISDDILDLTRIPESTIVLGGGAIALEMAHYLEALGSKVTVIQRGERLLKETDPEVSTVLEDAFSERGMAVHCGTRLLRAETHADGKRIVFEQGGETKHVTAEEILMALGRHPAIEGLGLENAGVKTEHGTVTVSHEQVTSTPHISAAGDVCGPYEIVHLAVLQGEVAAKNAARALGNSQAPAARMDYRLKLFGVFTEPQVATVGRTEAELREEGVKFKSASYPFNDHGKSMVMGEMHGFVKLLADEASGEILGGCAVGPEATDLIHEIVVAMHFHATAAQLAAIPHYHPTLSEIWTYPAEDLMG